MHACQECGRKFKTTKAAEKASMDGCPKCGGVDIDLYDEEFENGPGQPKNLPRHTIADIPASVLQNRQNWE